MSMFRMLMDFKNGFAVSSPSDMLFGHEEVDNEQQEMFRSEVWQNSTTMSTCSAGDPEPIQKPPKLLYMLRLQPLCVRRRIFQANISSKAVLVGSGGSSN